MRHVVEPVKGFSLIELMIVVAILGILSSLAVPAFTDYTQRTKATTAYLSLQPWQTAIALCWQEQGTLARCTPTLPSEENLPEGLTSLVAGAVDGALKATLKAFDSEGLAIIIEIRPQIKANQLTWDIYCSDLTLGPRIQRCIGPLPTAS